ncbi:PAC2 family protein [Brachybacterium sp. JHP9]|uniref:PAC2 family protein n=1 Tax=Brachybacterium equifaecis TaxID=2910770 RepID=A0ABT0R069_9MICO|nr:PAC2 family protein [Brachybacterium equifaecis]
MDPSTVFTYERHIDARTLRGSTLVVTLGAFTDAGAAQHLLDTHILELLDSRIIGRVDMDQVYDYTGHRPEITLDRDHFEDYEKPEILLHEVVAADGEPFFLLTGPEPSFQWERLASALRHVIEQLGVERTLLVQSFPAPVPHTRELPITRYGGASEDIMFPRPMPAVFRLRSTFTSVLTLRLHESGHPVVGLAAQVPQYLHETEYPVAALALLRAVREEGGPEIAPGELEVIARAVREGIDAQVAGNDQLQEMVRSLEENADRFQLADAAEAEVPSAEEIAAEVEQFLAGLDEGDQGPSEESHG